MKKLLVFIMMVLCFFALPASAFADTSHSRYVLESENDILFNEIKENIALERYNELLLYFNDGNPDYVDTEIDYPDYYGGAYLDDDKNLVIQIATKHLKHQSMLEIQNLLCDVLGADDIIFEKVNYSFKEIMDGKEMLAQQVFSQKDLNPLHNIIGVGTNLKENSITITLAEDSVETKTYTLADVKNFSTLTTKAFNGPHIRIEYGKPEKKQAAAYPGYKIHAQGSGSMGFWAYKTGNTSIIGIVTAAHVTYLENTAVSYGNKHFGYVHTRVSTVPMDAAFVEVSPSSGFTPTNSIPYLGCTHSRGTYQSVLQGATVYMAGMSSQGISGTVQDINYTSTQNTGVVKCSYVSLGGDSGGIVVTGGNSNNRTITGIHVSGDEYSYGCFMKAGKITSTSSGLGISVY